MNPLQNVPLNTKRQYVMAKTKSGCKVYMPVDSFSNVVLTSKKNQLQMHFDSIDHQDPLIAA